MATIVLDQSPMIAMIAKKTQEVEKFYLKITSSKFLYMSNAVFRLHEMFVKVEYSATVHDMGLTITHFEWKHFFYNQSNCCVITKSLTNTVMQPLKRL